MLHFAQFPGSSLTFLIRSNALENRVIFVWKMKSVGKSNLKTHFANNKKAILRMTEAEETACVYEMKSFSFLALTNQRTARCSAGALPASSMLRHGAISTTMISPNVE